MKAKFFLVVLCVMSISGVLLSQEKQNDSEPATFTFESLFVNKYLWRGITYDEGLVIQPSLTMYQNNWTLMFWGNYVVSDSYDDVKNHEFDIYVQYDFEFGDLTLSPNILFYSYPQQDAESTFELSLAGEYSLGDFSIGTSLSTDIKLGKSYLFGYHSVGYTKELGETLELNASGGFGWGTENFNEYYIGIKKSGLNYIYSNISLSYKMLNNVSLKPYAEVYFNTDSEYKEILGGTVANFGVTVSLEL